MKRTATEGPKWGALGKPVQGRFFGANEQFGKYEAFRLCTEDRRLAPGQKSVTTLSKGSPSWLNVWELKRHRKYVNRRSEVLNPDAPNYVTGPTFNLAADLQVRREECPNRRGRSQMNWAPVTCQSATSRWDTSSRDDSATPGQKKLSLQLYAWIFPATSATPLASVPHFHHQAA